ncbi:polyadenylate-binding protein 1-A isoform X2 [Octopus sinensis]|uniref:Polyadenylate-binding protein 1-A isoform X2 n=1 Tax=Octopus sinensis TaxID=2607531 RepID=A0A6P7T240_9MOLL|nr:polyadenylate-binding protein 1-A isoform X2 [Octopus sinensis]
MQHNKSVLAVKDKIMMNSKPEVYSCHIKYLPISVTKSQVADLFSDYDDLFEIYISERVMEHNYTFGFVRFKSQESANHAVKSVSGKMVNGQKLLVSHAKSSVATDSDPSSLIVSSIKKQLKEEFASTDKEINELLEEASSKRWTKTHHSASECAFSLELTDILTDTMDYKYWNEFFSRQKEISRKLKMIQMQTSANGSR